MKRSKRIQSSHIKLYLPVKPLKQLVTQSRLCHLLPAKGGSLQGIKWISKQLHLGDSPSADAMRTHLHGATAPLALPPMGQCLKLPPRIKPLHSFSYARSRGAATDCHFAKRHCLEQELCKNKFPSLAVSMRAVV